jgi:hypothetical protein
MVAPLIGFAAAQGAAFLTRSLIKQLAARGWGINKVVEQAAVQGAAMLAAQGVNHFTAAAQAIANGTNQPVSVRVDAQGRPTYTLGGAPSAAAPPAPVAPPPGPQTTLQGMAASGQVSPDMVMPTWPTMYQR